MPLNPRPNTPDKLVYEICNAYESGIGHGLKQDNAPNPYEELTFDYLAYSHGYEIGSERIEREKNILAKIQHLC